eukprot:4968014-Prymnesium_polylepis.2
MRRARAAVEPARNPLESWRVGVTRWHRRHAAQKPRDRRLRLRRGWLVWLRRRLRRRRRRRRLVGKVRLSIIGAHGPDAAVERLAPLGLSRHRNCGDLLLLLAPPRAQRRNGLIERLELLLRHLLLKLHVRGEYSALLLLDVERRRIVLLAVVARQRSDAQPCGFLCGHCQTLTGPRGSIAIPTNGGRWPMADVVARG